MKIVFKDLSEIALVDSFGIGDLVAHYDEVTEVAADVEKCTEDNCSAMKIVADDGEIMAEYTDLVFAGVTTNASLDSTGVEAHFHFRVKNAEEKMLQMIHELQAQVADIAASQELQDGAIEDLAGSVSDLGEAQEVQDTAISDLADAVADIDETNTLQDGAIEDLAEAISDM